MKKHSRTKATSIDPKVKSIVYLRDGMRCVMCGCVVSERDACAHLIPRSQGGMGVEKNILTLCPRCHREYDEGPDRDYWKDFFTRYMESKYGPIKKSEVVYDKWGFLNGN